MNLLRQFFTLAVVLSALSIGSISLAMSPVLSDGITMRLYESASVYMTNPAGAPFELTLDVRDWNVMENGPREVLVKVYDPDGMALVRKVVDDDGIANSAYMSESGGWDHEMWYYLLCYSRGSVPMMKWSSFTDPARVAALARRTFTFPIRAGKKGIYTVMVAGCRDNVVTIRTDQPLKYAVSGHSLWMHGYGDLLARSYVYVPEGSTGLDLGFVEFDQPVTRTFTITAPDGTKLWEGMAKGGFQRTNVKFDPPGKFDDQVLVVDVSEGSGAYMMHIQLNRTDIRPYRGIGSVPVLFAPDAETAKALKGGAIYHDGQVFWHGFQVRLYDWLKNNLKPEDYIVRDADGNEIKPTEGRSYGWGAKSLTYKGLPEAPGFIPLNGAHEAPPLCDTLMHNYMAHKNPNVRNIALRDLADGLRTISVGDMPIITNWGGNLGYAFGTYGFHYWRPAWRIIQQSDAPQEAKDLFREAIILCGDRLAFGHGIERSNGNAMSHIPMALRYAVEATKDPLLTELFNTYFTRFTTEGWGQRSGISKSGDCQEHFAHDFHYGTYILASYSAVINDLNDQRFKAVTDRINNLYSYLYCAETIAYPWGSRTAQSAGAGSKTSKAQPGPDFTVSVNDGDEWFAARRANYYMLTFHGKLTPAWLNNYFGSNLGYGGGIMCQVTVPGRGTVIASTLAGSYGAGMQPRNWRNFHIHSIVGTLADGEPLVAADSEHLNAKLAGATVSGDGEVRNTPVHIKRSYTYGENSILCEAQLSDTDYRAASWGHGQSSVLEEAYEMIPFFGGPPKQKTRVQVLDANGAITGDLGKQPVTAGGVVIDRGGYGVKIILDAPHPVQLGNTDTILIQLIDKRTPAEQIGISYTLFPYIGEAPAGTSTTTVVPKEYPLAKIPPVEKIDGVAAAVAGQQPHMVMFDGKSLAELRFAVAGDQLALQAKVIDQKMTADPVPWKTSCLEVFGALPGKPEIGQVFLAPKVGDTPAKGYRSQKGNIEPAPQIRLLTSPTPTGYELQALIPLILLALDPAADKLLLEFQLTAIPPGTDQKAYQHATLFGSIHAYEDSRLYGVFQVGGKGK